MSEEYKPIFEAARRLPPEQQWRLAAGLLALLTRMEQQATAETVIPVAAREELIAALRKTQRRLAEAVAAFEAENQTQSQAAPEPGLVRRHFGAWDSGDERSADNERIDIDLAREYDNSR